MDVEIVDEERRSRYVTRVDGSEAELVYRRRGSRVVLVHTGVPDELEGRGLGGALVRFAVEDARRRGETVVVQCPFARTWLRRHPEVAEQVEIDGRGPSRDEL